MNFSLILIIIVGLILFGIVVRYIIRSYFAEKRRHLSMLMHGPSGPNFIDETKDDYIPWKSVNKEKGEK